MSLYRTAVSEWTAIPWRLRTGIEKWVEFSAREQLPALYRLLHFGRTTNPVHPVTQGPGHHFFGYYDKSPWNASGHLLLAHEAEFNDRPPAQNDPVTVGVVRLQDGEHSVGVVRDVSGQEQRIYDCWLHAISADGRTGHSLNFARLHSPKSRCSGEIRFDLHPRRDRGGGRMRVASFHHGSRQMDVIDVSGLAK